MEDNTRIYVTGIYLSILFLKKHIIHQNTFTGFLKLPVAKKQHKIVPTAHINRL